MYISTNTNKAFHKKFVSSHRHHSKALSCKQVCNSTLSFYFCIGKCEIQLYAFISASAWLNQLHVLLTPGALYHKAIQSPLLSAGKTNV